jgi:DNA-binding transcriptional LysR family regulator
MVRFTLRQCRYFRAVAEAGGIAQAARVLNISQPSVAEAIAKLEAATGLELVERRHARGVALTLQGRQFLESVIRLEAEAERAAQDAAALASGRKGRLRLGLFWTLSPFYGPNLIRAFSEAEPDVQVIPEEASLTDLAEALEKGGIDIAFTYSRGADLSAFDVIELDERSPQAVLAANHPLAAGDSVSLRDLAGLPYVMFEGSGSRSYFDDLLTEIGLTPAIAYASSSMETVRSAVANGFGFTLLVMQPFNQSSYDGKPLRILPIAEPVPRLGIVLAMRRGERRDALLTRFCDVALACTASDMAGP